MVSTRSHPSAFPPPDLLSPTKPSPSKRGSRASSTAPTTNNATTTAITTTTKPTTSSSSSPQPHPQPWSHTPSRLTLLWLALSLPLVVWDTAYMLLRPHTMPGGSLHRPLWQPYALYGTVDHVYGFPAWEAGDGFGGAQAALNAVETALYAAYLAMVWAKGKSDPSAEGRGALGSPGKVGGGGGGGGGARVLSGRVAGRAVAVAFAASVMTLSKTVLYWANEAFGGWAHIGHNDLSSLVVLWIIPNGLWLIFPTYMIYVFGGEIVQGLEAASGGAAASSGKKSQ